MTVGIVSVHFKYLLIFKVVCGFIAPSYIKKINVIDVVSHKSESLTSWSIFKLQKEYMSLLILNSRPG